MTNKDVISKELIRQIVKDMAIYLLGLNISELEELPTEQQRIETRHADVVMRATLQNGDNFILHLELQDANHPRMPLRMLRYFTDIALAYPDERILQYVVYTGSQPLRMSDQVAGENWSYGYRIIDMHTLDCDRFIREDNPDALVLAVLCDFKGRDSREVLEGIIGRLIELTAQQPDQLYSYLKMLETLSTNRHLETLFKKVENDMLTKIDVEKLPSYMIGFDHGVEKGEEKGQNSQKIAIAKTALRQGMTIEQISELTGLSLASVEQLKNDL